MGEFTKTPMDVSMEHLEKVKRVLRLANRAGTDGERQAALLAAKRLSESYGIDLSEVEFDRETVRTGIEHDSEWERNLGCAIGHITAIMRKHFGVIVIQNKLGRRVRYSWIGTQLNIAVAKHVFHVLARESTRAWNKVMQDRKYARAAIGYNSRGDSISISRLILRDAELERMRRVAYMNRTSFMYGWFGVIDRKLTENPLRNDLDQLKMEGQAAMDAMNAMSGIEHAKARKSSLDYASALVGARSAESVNLTRPVSGDAYSKARELN